MTDIVVLVVAADDGVMPQTVEAINHARAAEVPIVVAINKVDRDNADPQKVMNQLSEQGLVPESWGGDTIMVEMSALQNLGIDDLLEQLTVVAELEELTANPQGRAKGIVLEANLDTGRGPVATVLVDKGTLKVGDPIVAGAAWGSVRALIDDQGQQVKEAGPSTPVQVLGLSSVPGAGDEFRAAPDLKTAKTVAEAREQAQRLRSQRGDSRVNRGVKLEDIFEQIQKGEAATLNLVLKADVQGSLEALTESLRKLERDEVRLAFVHRAVGGISENDITLAATTNATIIGFNVRPDRKARELADAEDVEIRTYEIIYQVLEDIERAMVGMLAPEFEEVVTGEAEVREIFRVPRVGAIAGCYVRSRRHHPGLQGPLPARRRHHLEGRDHVAEAVQGGRPRGPGGLRVRHRPVRLPGPEAGRPHRDLRGAGDPPQLTPAVPAVRPPDRAEARSAMFVLALEVDLHIAEARSLKDKRSVVKSLVEGARGGTAWPRPRWGTRSSGRGPPGLRGGGAERGPCPRGDRRGRPVRVVPSRGAGAGDGTEVARMTRPRRTRRPASPNQVPRTARLGQVLREIVGRGARADRRRAPRARPRHRRRRRRRPEPGHRVLRLAHRRGRRPRRPGGLRRPTGAAAGRRRPSAPRPQDADPGVPPRRRAAQRRAHRQHPAATSIGSRTIARRKPANVHGLAVVDKPAGWTSHDVVAKARGILGEKRVGHAGTLDPDATGVLLLGVGR